MTSFQYQGSELALFSAARNWKRYWTSKIIPYLRGEVLEVGAGIGTNTPYLCQGACTSWVCLEPDPGLLDGLVENLRTLRCGTRLIAKCGTLDALDSALSFDAIVYIDVLEHIEDDRAELCRAGSHLRAGGHLVVLAPAHQWLFTQFDKNIGHYRRYDRPGLIELSPSGLKLVQAAYLDSIGVLASLANRLLLRQGLPSERQILAWDSYMVPTSRIVDRILGYRVGKSILTVWRKGM